MTEEKCPKCNNTGIVKEKDGSVHVCFDCLNKGKLDQHSKDIKEAKVKI
ncbi:MAG: hypothetical protein QXQ82_02205 [Candidatus Pacearchaeota archaeon]